MRHGVGARPLWRCSFGPHDLHNSLYMRPRTSMGNFVMNSDELWSSTAALKSSTSSLWGLTVPAPCLLDTISKYKEG